MHHLLEDKSFINDFGTQSSAGPSFVQLSAPISFMLPPPVNKENIDTPEELAYVKEMQEVRQSVVKTVPAYQKREEELNLKNAARKAETQGDEGGECATAALSALVRELPLVVQQPRQRARGRGRAKLGRSLQSSALWPSQVTCQVGVASS